MPILRSVEFWTGRGKEDRRRDVDGACEAMFTSGRRVAEAYSEVIARRRMVGKDSHLRVFLGPARDRPDDVELLVHLDHLGGFEMAHARIPSVLATVGPAVRAEVSLQILSSTMAALAPERGWASDDLRVAEDEVRRRGLETDEADDVDEVPPIHVTGARDVPSVPEIRFCGGGPANDVPASYLDELQARVLHLSGAGLDWWAPADRNLLEVYWWIVDTKDSIRVRRTADRVTANIERTLASFATGDARALAREDVSAVVGAVSKRMGLERPATL